MSRTMIRRIDAGEMLEQIVYNVPDRVRNVAAFDPEKPKRERFQTPEEYERHKVNISRRNHLRWFQENFGPTSFYSTLTFDDEHEVHTFREAKQIRANIRRVLQYACPDAVFFIYMGRGKSTDRIHFHMVSDGLDPQLIAEKWKYGSIKKIKKLRAHNFYNGVDHGADYTGLANYCFDHWTQEVGGHRWMMTKNARRPEIEEPEDAEDTYGENNPPEAPEGYHLVEVETTKYGYMRFKFMHIEKKREQKKKPIKVKVRIKKKPVRHRLD